MVGWTSEERAKPLDASVAPVRTLIVDDHPMFRLALREVVSRQPGLVVVAETGSVAEAIAYVANHIIDVAIVDILLPDARGVTFVRHLRAVQPACKVLAVSGIDEPLQMAEMLRAGASGVAHKSQPGAEIVAALRAVIAGERSVPGSMRDQIEQLLGNGNVWPLDRLTPREREIFDLLVAGYANKDIATKLFISPRTVETHRQRITSKLAARSVNDLFQLALRHGLIG